MNKRIQFLLLMLLIAVTECYSECSSFCFSAKDTILFGNNLDYHIGDGLIVVNKRNVTKSGCWFENQPTWTSKYGSITINQFGREFPSRGMNEVGLVVGEMTLEETTYPAPDSRTPISAAQWRQYILDNCATIEDVIKTDTAIRIHQNQHPSHFFVADSTGNCVTMEWIDGELVYHTRNTLPVTALTNSSYESSIVYYNQNEPPSPSDISSKARFYRIADMIDNYGNESEDPMVTYAFKILKSVSMGDWTKWSLVFDITNRRFYFRTNLNKNVQYVDFDSFDFTCDDPVKMFVLDNQYSGDVHSYFIDYDIELNRALVMTVYEKLEPYIGEVSETDKEKKINYPVSTFCNTTNIPMDQKMLAFPQHRLFQNYPNPFNPETTIKYSLQFSGHVILTIFNLSGQTIETLVNRFQYAGEHDVIWRQSSVPTGIYFYRLQVDDLSSPNGAAGLKQSFSETKKLIFQK